MKKLTAEKCRSRIETLLRLKNIDKISIEGDYHLQAYQIALPVLEQQEHPTDTYRQIENNGWLHWNGEMALPPVKSHVLVEVKRRNGGLIQRQAQEFAWRNSPVKSGTDIIAYRVIENDGREG